MNIALEKAMWETEVLCMTNYQRLNLSEGRVEPQEVGDSKLDGLRATNGPLMLMIDTERWSIIKK